MYALLAICLSLCPHPKLVEESVNNQLQENYAEKMLHMQCSDEAICLMNYFSMPAPSSSPHPHTNMASPSSTSTRYGATANYVPT
jgi:translation initiation factor 3 subunit L